VLSHYCVVTSPPANLSPLLFALLQSCHSATGEDWDSGQAVIRRDDAMNEKHDAKLSSDANGASAGKSATKIRIVEDAEATGETAAAYDYWRAGSGRQQVPGIIKCFGARPDFLRRIVELGNTIHFSEGHLSRRHKEMIASYVSFLNRCPY
jgi:hypothetical protein